MSTPATPPSSHPASHTQPSPTIEVADAPPAAPTPSSCRTLSLLLQAVRVYSSNSTVQLLAEAAAQSAEDSERAATTRQLTSTDGVNSAPSPREGEAPAAADSPGGRGAAAGQPEAPLPAGAAAAAPAFGAESLPLECPTCAAVQALPLAEWTAEAAAAPGNATQLPWGQVVEFEPVDYAAAAQVVCDCLAGGWWRLASPCPFIIRICCYNWEWCTE